MKRKINKIISLCTSIVILSVSISIIKCLNLSINLCNLLTLHKLTKNITDLLKNKFEDGSFIEEMNIPEGDDDFLYVDDIKSIVENYRQGIETFKIELGLMNNDGYPNNVVKVMEIKSEFKDDILNYFRNIKKSASSYVVTFQKNKFSNEESYYLEIDQNTYESEDPVLKTLNTLGNNYTVN